MKMICKSAFAKTAAELNIELDAENDTAEIADALPTALMRPASS